LWFLSMVHVLYHPCGTLNFEVAPDFWKICEPLDQAVRH
jgi:hypothetical protein